MHPFKQKSFFLISTFVFLFMAGASAVKGADLSAVTVTAASLVPGEETRYIVKFRAEGPLDLSKGAGIKVELPQGFRIIQNDILAADPGCTLTRLEYKMPQDRFYGVVRGTMDVKDAIDNVQCTFTPQAEQLVIPAGTDLYLTLPGVINPPVTGPMVLNLMIQDIHGVCYQGEGQFNLGLPPATVPRQVRLVDATSYEVTLAWDPVPGAKRYRVTFSSQPDGYFISALDLSREPYPGEDWQLADTTHTFSGRGNGGLLPGRTYYFKVQAGNEAGFGPSSKLLPVTLPEIRPRDKRMSTAVLPENTPAVWLDQPVKIADPDAIIVYEKPSGIKVQDVQVLLDEADGRMIRVSAKMQPGQEYMVVFYEGALESRVKANVVNNTFGWTAIVEDGSQGGKK
ncbi:MAG: fibronectin type III domain-containing protein [Syntrophotaleaceae bacterium]